MIGLKSLLCAAAVCLSAVSTATAVSAVVGLPNTAVPKIVYSGANGPTVEQSGGMPLTFDVGTPNLRVKVLQSTITISNLGGDFDFLNSQLNGIQVITLPTEVEFTEVKLQQVNKVFITGTPEKDQTKKAFELPESRLELVDAHTIQLNFALFTMLAEGHIVIHYRCGDDEVSSSSTGGDIPPPQPSTGGLDDGSSSTGGDIPGANGDPQITGFLGQSFQVHGTANTVYSVISSAALQYNALFSFLSEGKCRAGTECFAHPGNYFGAVGMLIKQEDGKVAKIEVTAGAVDEGMKVTIDGEPLTPSEKHLTIDSVNSLHFGSKFELLLQTRDYTLRLQNSDMFLNQQVSIRAPLLAQIQSFKSKSSTNVSELPHGILGQTWRRMSYPNRWVHLEGDLMNYIVAEGLMAVPSEMNRFKSA